MEELAHSAHWNRHCVCTALAPHNLSSRPIPLIPPPHALATSLTPYTCAFLLQNITLGGTGKEHGDRHPKIGDNVLIGANSSVGAFVLLREPHFFFILFFKVLAKSSLQVPEA